MKKTMLFGVAACFAWSAYGAETGEIVEIFGCNLKAGKTMADFDATVSGWQKDMEKNEGVKNYFAAVLVPYRAKSDYDVVWLGSNPNLNDWAKGAAIDYTAVGRAAQARFDTASTCDAGLYFGTTLYEGLAEGNPMIRRQPSKRTCVASMTAKRWLTSLQPRKPRLRRPTRSRRGRRN